MINHEVEYLYTQGHIHTQEIRLVFISGMQKTLDNN